MKSRSKQIIINGRFLTQEITGVQRFAIEICLKLTQLYDDVIILAPRNILQKESFEKLNGRIIGKNKGHVWEQLDLPKYVLREFGNNYILVNLCNTGPLFLKKSVITIHDIAVLKFPEWYSKPFYLFYRFALPLLVKNALHVITVSEFSKSEIVKYFRLTNDSVSVVCNAVADFPTSNDRSNPYKEYHNYFLALSSMNPRKNFVNTIKGFISADVDADLLLVGGMGKSFSRLDYEIPDSHKERIHFLGYVKDEYLPYLYTNARCFLYLSLYEGFGIPPLEAMKYDAPVMVSKTSSMPEVCGNAAFYVDPKDLDEISKTIQAAADPQNKKEIIRLIDNSKHVLSKYSWEKSVNQLSQILDKVL